MKTQPTERKDDSDQPQLGETGLFASEGGVLDRALVLVEYLREQCAWDRKQTARSLVPHLLEEAHETVDAIHARDGEALRGELGDLLLNLAFQVVVGEGEERFTREEVMRELEEKMVRRHPQIFGEGEPQTWEALKCAEREGATLDGLASGLDPLLRAHRIQERAAGIGFDWEDPNGALDKVREELQEVEAALAEGLSEPLDEEIGDLLFSVVNVARLAGRHAVASLGMANAKFEGRFRALEALALDRGVTIPGATLAELDELWEEVKRQEPEPAY